MQVKVEKYKGEKALEAGLQQMLAAGWKVQTQSSQSPLPQPEDRRPLPFARRATALSRLLLLPFRSLLFRRALLTQPRNHAGRSDLLAESRRSYLPDRVQLLPQRRLRCGALCRDLLRRSLLPLVRHLRPGNELRGPQASLLRRRSSGVASGRGFLPTVLRQHVPRLPFRSSVPSSI